MPRLPMGFAVITMAALTATPTSAQVEQYRSALHDYQVVTVVDELDNPWAMAFLPNGDMLVTERPGRLRIVRAGTLLPTPVPGVPEVYARGQGGLLDVILHPEFATNRMLYMSYSKPLEDGSTTAVIRARFENDALSQVEEIFEADTRGGGHYGSRLAFDDAGYLFITVGDRQANPLEDQANHPAQDVSNHHGTVNRLHDDGRIPTDNPFVDQEGAEPSIWSYGHRNPQGLSIHPQTGDIWITEHGPQGGDELNLIQPGNNYGWPVIGHGVNYGAGNPIHQSSRAEGMEGPAHFWVPSIATSGLLIYTGGQFPDWRGNVFAGGLAGQQIARLTMDGQSVESEETLVQGMGQIRAITQGPDGYIYVASSAGGGTIVRLEPAG